MSLLSLELAVIVLACWDGARYLATSARPYDVPERELDPPEYPEPDDDDQEDDDE